MFDTRETSAETSGFPIHHLSRADAGRVADFVSGLDEAALQVRFDRFMTAGAVRAHYDAIDWTDAMVLAWVAGPGVGGGVGGGISRGICGGICGVAETFFYDTARGLEAETALCVGQGWRGRGIGRLMLARALSEAARRGAWRSVIVLGSAGCGHTRLVVRLGGAIEAGTDVATVVH